MSGGAIFSDAVPIIINGGSVTNTQSSDTGAIFVEYATVSVSNIQTGNNTAQSSCAADLYCTYSCDSGSTYTNQGCAGVSFSSSSFQCCSCSTNTCPCKSANCVSTASSLTVQLAIILSIVIAAMI